MTSELERLAGEYHSLKWPRDFIESLNGAAERKREILEEIGGVELNGKSFIEKSQSRQLF